MKRILIVSESFATGGIESSLINMANELVSFCQVDLFLYNPVGAMKDRLDKRVKIIEPTWRLNCIGMSLSQVLHSRNFKCILFRLFATVWTKAFNNKLPINIAISHQPVLGNYDLAVAFHHERRKKTVTSGFARVVDKCVHAKKKVAWLHYDAGMIDLDSKFNRPFYLQMDKVFCVSKSLINRFVKHNACLTDKMDYCYNFLPYDLIKSQSLMEQEVKYENGFICFSACRLSAEKGIVRAINALADIFHCNCDIRWYIAGEGNERDNITKAIINNGLERQVILIGNQKNPYSYMKNADLVLVVSYHEAAPMVYLESKAVGTPIFSTLTSSTRELLDDGKDSFICENSEAGLKKGFNYVVNNKELVKAAKVHLASQIMTNDASIQKIKELLN